MLITVTAATVEPVTVEEARAALGITHTEDDAVLAQQISSARQQVERWTGLALADAGYRWVGAGESLPVWPAVVTLIKSGGVTLAASMYDVETGRLSGVDGLPLVVEFTAAPGVVPDALCSSIKMLVRAEYDADPQSMQVLREQAYKTAFPWRINLGD